MQDVLQFKMFSFVLALESIYKMNPMCFHNFTSTSSIYEYHTKHSYRGDVFLTHKNSLQYGFKSIRYIRGHASTLKVGGTPVCGTQPVYRKC